MSPPAPRRGPRACVRAFTLIEVLVAIAILGLIVVLVAQIFNGSTAAISQNDKSMDALDAAQVVFQQVGLDISRMIQRDDVDYTFVKNAAGAAAHPAGNDVLSFYAQTSGLSSTGAPVNSSPRPLSVVGYKIRTNANGRQEFGYGALQVDWTHPAAAGTVAFVLSAFSNGSQTQLFTAPNTLPDPEASPDVIPYTTLAPEVIRFEYSFVLKTDPYHTAAPQIFFVPSPVNAPVNPLPSLTNLPTTAKPNPLVNLSNVAALVVGIVTIDPKSRLLLPTGTDLKVAKLFPDAIPSQDILSLWTPLVANTASLQAQGVPAKALAGIHVYQKYFPLTK